MDLRLLYAIILTLMPISELRLGMPLAIRYALDKNISLGLIFLLIVLVNIILIFFILYFLDHLHGFLLNNKSYRNSFEFFLKKFQKKIDKFEKKYETLGFLALTFFVAVPLPGTGAWGGSLISWLLGLERKKSILAISIGVIISGIIIFFGTLGFNALFS